MITIKGRGKKQSVDPATKGVHREGTAQGDFHEAEGQKEQREHVYNHGRTDELTALLRTVHEANPYIEDIRQGLEGPHVKDKRERLAKEEKHYRNGTTYQRGFDVKVDRELRRQEFVEAKPYIYLELQLMCVR